MLRPGAVSNASAPGAPPAAESEPSLRGEVDLTNIKLSFEQKWKVEGVVSKQVHEKLERCKKLLSRKFPDGVDYDKLFDEMTELYLDKNDPERRKVKQRASDHKKSNHTRYIPVDIKSHVWKRDGGRCALWVATADAVNVNLICNTITIRCRLPGAGSAQ
jgi:hypothetical protein